ncbi:MAG: GFA family protein [Reyranella sp.]|nr:GFA family protein [Reyranella sp.]
MTRRATCCCGQCTIDVDGEPEINAVCHCRNCKKRTGSAFGWSTYFADSQIIGRTGDVAVYMIGGANPQQRWFCRNCGSTLFWKAARLRGRTGVAGGCFTDNSLGPPSVTVSNDGRCAWVGLPGDWRTSL